MRNNSWELFLGAFGKVRGNNARNSLGTTVYWCGNCGKDFKGGVPGKVLGKCFTGLVKKEGLRNVPKNVPGNRMPKFQGTKGSFA